METDRPGSLTDPNIKPSAAPVTLGGWELGGQELHGMEGLVSIPHEMTHPAERHGAFTPATSVPMFCGLIEHADMPLLCLSVHVVSHALLSPWWTLSVSVMQVTEAM